MPLQNALPYGLRQVMLTPYSDQQGTTLSNVSYPLPVAMTLGFSESEQFDELRGDDQLVAVHGRGAQVDWSLESGGLPITAWSVITGGRVIESGVTPNRKVRLRKSADDQRPYFRIDGRMISDSGGSVVARIYRAKANGRIQGDHRNGAFMTSSIDGIGMPLLNDAGRWLYEIIQMESDSALATTPEANPIPIPANLLPGTLTATSAALSWDAITGATQYSIQQSVDNGVTWAAATPATSVTNSVTVTSLTASTNYRFRVAATVGTLGDYSPSVGVLTPAA